MEISLRLAPAPDSPARARRVVDETFPEWGCDELADDAKVVVSELVTNAVLHARTELDLVLELRPSELRVSVTDRDGDGAPVVAETGAEATRGRGLHMVRKLSDRWGVEYRMAAPTGKTIWAAWELPR